MLHLRLSFVVLVIMLAISQQSTCRHIHKSIREENKQTDDLSWHFSARAPEGSDKDDIDPSYGVSLRGVPGGPNPLHN